MASQQPLPEYLIAMERFFQDAMRHLAIAEFPSLAASLTEPVDFLPESHGLPGVDGTTVEDMRASSELTFSTASIIAVDADAWVHSVASCASATGAAMMGAFASALDRVADGRSVIRFDGLGRHGVDYGQLLSVLERMDVEFDEDGRPDLAPLCLITQDGRKTWALLELLEELPEEFHDRLSAILSAKWEAVRAR